MMSKCTSLGLAAAYHIMNICLGTDTADIFIEDLKDQIEYHSQSGKYFSSFLLIAAFSFEAIGRYQFESARSVLRLLYRNPALLMAGPSNLLIAGKQFRQDHKRPLSYISAILPKVLLAIAAMAIILYANVHLDACHDPSRMMEELSGYLTLPNCFPIVAFLAFMCFCFRAHARGEFLVFAIFASVSIVLINWLLAAGLIAFLLTSFLDDGPLLQQLPQHPVIAGLAAVAGISILVIAPVIMGIEIWCFHRGRPSSNVGLYKMATRFLVVSYGLIAFGFVVMALEAPPSSSGGPLFPPDECSALISNTKP